MRLANWRSASGGIASSSVATRYHDGRNFQAGSLITSRQPQRDHDPPALERFPSKPVQPHSHSDDSISLGQRGLAPYLTPGTFMVVRCCSLLYLRSQVRKR